MSFLSRQIQIKHYPSGKIKHETMDIFDVEYPDIPEGGFYVSNMYCISEPSTRAIMIPFSVNPLETEIENRPGHPLTGSAIGIVAASRNPSMKEGTLLYHKKGLRTAAMFGPNDWYMKIPSTNYLLTHYLSVLNSRTPYVAAHDILNLSNGKKLLLSGATGKVGQFLIQFAHLKGCEVYAMTSTYTKAKWLKEKLNVEHVLVPSENLSEELLEMTGADAIDCYQEHVDNKYFAAAMKAMKPGGIMSICGLMAQYNNAGIKPGPVLQPLIDKGLVVKGFFLGNYTGDKLFEEYFDFMEPIIDKLYWEEKIVTGLEKCIDEMVNQFDAAERDTPDKHVIIEV